RLNAAFSKVSSPQSGEHLAVKTPPKPATPTSSTPPEALPGSRKATLAPMPPLVDLFAALLEAEHRLPDAAGVSKPLSRTDLVGASTEDMVEAVTQRVLERLPQHLLSELVPDLVATLAERLIKEEIERIKATIR